MSESASGPSAVLDTAETLTRVKVFREKIIIALTDGVEQATKNWREPRAFPNSCEHDLRLVHASVAKHSGGDLAQDPCECGRLLLDWDGVVHVLVTEAFYSRRQMTKED